MDPNPGGMHRAVMLKILTGGPFRIPIARANPIVDASVGTPIGDALVGQSGNQMMHISPRSVVSRMSRHVARSRSLERGEDEARKRRARYRIVSPSRWVGGLESREAGGPARGGPAYGCDEVESLRPDASLTMSLPARYLRARQPLAPRRILARIRAMRLKSPRRRCSCTLGCSSRLLGSYTGRDPRRGLAGRISSRRGVGVVFSGCRYAW